MVNLPEEELRRGMKKLYNYENIVYPELKERSNRLRKENKELKVRVKALEEDNKQIEKLLLELEELKEMQYGKKQNDESTWKVQGESEGNYVWVKTGTESNKVIFWFGRCRGKSVAERLRGDTRQKNVANQVGISDDYAGYRTLFNNHQLCWAHPHRKLRDLAESEVLKDYRKKHCQKVFKEFAKIYKDTSEAKEKFDSGGYKNNKKKKERDEEKLRKQFEKITIPDNKDPVKLKKIRKALGKRIDKYFTCLQVQGIPMDNNKAERALRRIVLKRKKSFGSKTQKGANVLSILYSVVFSIYWSNPSEEFFEHYQTALNLLEK